MRLSRTDGGLIVPEGDHELAVNRALREHDDRLRLVPQDSDHFGRRIYKVYRYNGPDRDADFILFWGDPGKNEAYPLSMQIVDEVKRHDRSSRGFDVEDPDVINARLIAENRAKAREEGEALVADVEAYTSGRKTFGTRFPKTLRRE